MHIVRSSLGIALAVMVGPLAAWAETTTTTATVTATVPSRASLALATDDNSIATSAATVAFNKYDDEDIAGGSASLMYAPYRSNRGKNWHILRLSANGSSMTLTASASGPVGSKNLAELLKVWFGGFCNADGDCSDGKSSDWEKLSTLSRSKSGAYSGVVPLNYQLDVSGVSANTYTGNITYTLVSN